MQSKVCEAWLKYAEPIFLNASVHRKAFEAAFAAGYEAGYNECRDECTDILMEDGEYE